MKIILLLKFAVIVTDFMISEMEIMKYREKVCIITRRRLRFLYWTLQILATGPKSGTLENDLPV